MTKDDLGKAIATLGESLEPPQSEPFRDLERARRGLRRHRTRQGLAAATVTAVVAGGGFALSHAIGDDAPPPSIAQDPAATPSASETTAPPPAPRPVPSDRILAGFQKVLAAHLDPQWAHLVPQRPNNANEQSRGDATGIVGLGSKYAWRNRGDDGLGMLQLMVERHPEQGVGPCGLAPVDSCTRIEAPQAAKKAWRLVADGSVGVVVRRDDGSQVTLTANPLFGNNSLVPLASMDLDVDALLRAASDPALVLPEVIGESNLLPPAGPPAGARR